MRSVSGPVDRLAARTRWFPGYLAAFAVLTAAYFFALEGLALPLLPVMGVTLVVLVGFYVFVSTRGAIPRDGVLGLKLALGTAYVLYLLAQVVHAQFLDGLSPTASTITWAVASLAAAAPLMLASRYFAARLAHRR